MNRLSEYITGMTLTRQLLNEARIRLNKPVMTEKDNHQALRFLVEAMDSLVKATNNAVSIREKKKPKVKS